MVQAEAYNALVQSNLPLCIPVGTLRSPTVDVLPLQPEWAHVKYSYPSPQPRTQLHGWAQQNLPNHRPVHMKINIYKPLSFQVVVMHNYCGKSWFIHHSMSQTHWNSLRALVVEQNTKEANSFRNYSLIIMYYRDDFLYNFGIKLLTTPSIPGRIACTGKIRWPINFPPSS